MGKKVVGVDFGHGVVRGVEVDSPDAASARVTRTAEVPVPEGAIVNGEVREVHAVAAAVKRLWSAGGFKSKRVVLGMGNPRVLARDLTMPAMPRAQIKESLPFQVQDLLPVPVANAILDFYPVTQTPGDNGPVLHGLLIAALKDVVMANIAAVRLAGLEVVGVDLIPFALTRLLVEPGQRETIAFIDVGATTTNVSIAVGGIPQFVRIIPAGGEDVTRAIIDRTDLTRDQAEAAKKALGIPLAGVDEKYRHVADIIMSESGQLLTGLRNTINYFVTSHPEGVARIVATGGGAQLRGFAQALGDMTRIPTTVADPARDPRLTVALGLAMGSAA